MAVAGRSTRVRLSKRPRLFHRPHDRDVLALAAPRAQPRRRVAGPSDGNPAVARAHGAPPAAAALQPPDPALQTPERHPTPPGPTPARSGKGAES
jgi:hypothetical protein